MAQPEVATDYERLASLAKERASLEATVTLFRRYQELKLRAEEELRKIGHKRVFCVTHPHNEANNALLEKMGYTKMYLWERQS